ncbi:hypothetical protein [Sporosarcina psychrophila]|uniref:hypothetical protein n=1 Tax=Sporosarcina psychrophila TaxID=1476 RepID=UPI00078CD641|nr:hypothetical protein [Sporosarcina psychrophila]AMQ05902.1 hypothetical protein AZE41_08220 [Sporosarcina psychrophila]
MNIKNMLGDSDITILVKFVEPQFVETTMDGNIYFARNKHFIELEEQEKNKGIADKHEGSWSRVLDDSHRVFLEVDGEMLPLHTKTAVLRNRYDGLSLLPICCFVFLSLKNDFEIIPNENKIKLKSEVDIELRKQFNGRHMILFSDITKVFERFDKSIESMKYPLAKGLVTYYDDKINSHPLSEEEYEKNPARALLYKVKFFEHQKEYRFIINKPLDEDVIVELGDIKDIANDLGVVGIDKQLPFEIIFKEAE